jgi:hypothetical protein
MVNLVQTDVEEFTSPATPLIEFKHFEKRGVDYFLNNVQIPSVTRIIGSGGGGKASFNGNVLHEAMNTYFGEEFSKLGISVKELFKDCNPEDFDIPIKLSAFLKENGLRVFAREYKFSYEVDGCVYAGTIDLIAIDKDGNLYVFDYKTGVSKDVKQHLQVASYSHSVKGIYIDYFKKHGFRDYVDSFFVRGFLVYRTGVEEVDISLFESTFKPLLLAYYGKMEGYINHRGKIYTSNDLMLAHSEAIKQRKLEIAFYKSQIKELESEIEVDKEIIIATLEKEKPFKDDNILLIWNKGKIQESLMPKAIEEFENIRKNNPEWFVTTQGKGYYSVRLANKNKE